MIITIKVASSLTYYQNYSLLHFYSYYYCFRACELMECTFCMLYANSQLLLKQKQRFFSFTIYIFCNVHAISDFIHFPCMSGCLKKHRSGVSPPRHQQTRHDLHSHTEAKKKQATRTRARQLRL